MRYTKCQLSNIQYKFNIWTRKHHIFHRSKARRNHWLNCETWPCSMTEIYTIRDLIRALTSIISKKLVMKIRRKYHCIVLSWFVLGSVLILLSMYVSQLFLLITIIFSCMLGILTTNLKCSKCGRRILHNEVNIFGIKFKIWTSWIPSKCSNCGELFE
jgi:hypothetical protein